MKKTINKTTKNYIILIILFIIVIFIYSTVIKIYQVNKIASSSVLTTTIAMISLNDFENYIIENHSGLVYMPSLKESNNKFENEFLDLIIAKHLEEQIVYLNIGNFNYNKAKERILNDYTLENEKGIIFLFENKEIVDKLEIMNTYNFEDVKSFIENGNEVLIND